MCSIYGALAGSGDQKLAADIAYTFERARERGRDSWGLSALNSSGTIPVGVSIDGSAKPDLSKLDSLPGSFALIGSRRAEPTTEWVRQKRVDDVQPFRTPGGWLYAHNGTIANDRDLLTGLADQRRFFTPLSSIDSAVIGVALDCLGWEDGIRALSGSFAILAAHPAEPDVLRFAVNYKPLFAQAGHGGNLIQVASQRHYLPELGSPLLQPGPVELPPYTIGKLTAQGELEYATLYPPAGPKRRVLALCSGGLDATVAAWTHVVAGDEVTLLHIDYGCKAASREREAVERIAARIGHRAVVIPTEFFRNAVTSALTDDLREVQIAGGGKAAAELGHEWVPARNLVLLSMALAYAETYEFDVVCLGTNLEESAGGYPDNEQEFVNKIGQLVPYAVKPYRRIELSQPCGTLMKHEIVRLGHAIGAPVELSWSCYLGGPEHCGTCGPCWMRKTAHLMAGLVDPVFADGWNERHVAMNTP